MLPVLIFFRKDIAEILKAMWHALKTKDWSNKEAKLGLYIMAGTVITVALALPINEVAEKLVYSPAIVGILLFITGFTLLYSEYKSKKIEAKKTEVDLKNVIAHRFSSRSSRITGFFTLRLDYCNRAFLRVR